MAVVYFLLVKVLSRSCLCVDQQILDEASQTHQRYPCGGLYRVLFPRVPLAAYITCRPTGFSVCVCVGLTYYNLHALCVMGVVL